MIKRKTIASNTGTKLPILSGRSCRCQAEQGSCCKAEGRGGPWSCSSSSWGKAEEAVGTKRMEQTVPALQKRSAIRTLRGSCRDEEKGRSHQLGYGNKAAQLPVDYRHTRGELADFNMVQTAPWANMVFASGNTGKHGHNMMLLHIYLDIMYAA